MKNLSMNKWRKMIRTMHYTSDEYIYSRILIHSFPCQFEDMHDSGFVSLRTDLSHNSEMMNMEAPQIHGKISEKRLLTFGFGFVPIAP